MFYPSCPSCGGKTISQEPDIGQANQTFSHWMAREAAAHHSHPYLKLAAAALTGGYEIYKRVPGGGDKRCTSCGHDFK